MSISNNIAIGIAITNIQIVSLVDLCKIIIPKIKVSKCKYERMSTYHIPYESVALIMNPKIPAEIINAFQPFPFAYQQKNAKTGDSKVNKLHIMA